jgi:hypothetical protein
MKMHKVLGVTLGVLALAPAESMAAAYTRTSDTSQRTSVVELAQAGMPGWRGPGWRGPGWRGPGWRGGPPGWRGRPYWYARPWSRRPYYGTIIAGVALGTIVTVAAVGLVPARPAPNLCWYWADPYRNRGYWDYCY